MGKQSDVQPSKSNTRRNGSSVSITKNFAVPFVHRLRFTEDVLGLDSDALDELLESSGGAPAKVQFWMDQQLADASPDLVPRLKALADANPNVDRVGNVQMVPGGEDVKNDIHIIERMLKVFNVADLDRRSYVVVIGGGAVLDAVGFAAAIAHRGIRLIRLPTTTLAQADSGIGVKNAVNLFQKKNWIGSFAVPWGVINDAKILETLPDRDFIGGFSEAVKVTLLKDAAAFEQICESARQIANRDMKATLPIIQRSAELHLQHITEGGDPFEMLEARPLDYGHWSAHKLEALTNFEVRHGEAVAMGVAIDTVYSALKFGFPENSAQRVLNCLADIGFRLEHPMLREVTPLFEGLEEFRQHLGGRLTMTMLRDVGQPFEVHEVDYAKMREAIQEVLRFSEQHSCSQ